MRYITDIKDLLDFEVVLSDKFSISPTEIQRRDTELLLINHRLQYLIDNLLSEESIKNSKTEILVKKIDLIQKQIDWVRSFAEHLRNNINDIYIPDLSIHYTERPLKLHSPGFFRVHRSNCIELERSIEAVKSNYYYDYKTMFEVSIKKGLSYPECLNFYRDLIPNHADFADGCDNCRPYWEINDIISSEKNAIKELEAMLADMERQLHDLNNNR